MEKQKAIEIPASERYDSPYSGEQETSILQYAEKLKDQTAASDGDTVQVYDVDGNPHKVAKSELLKKSTLALPNLSDISKFVAVNAKGDAVGLMTKEQVAQVLGELMGISNLRQAFNLKKLSLKKGETGDIGYVSGLMTIMHAWSNASTNIIHVDTFSHKYTNVAGDEIEKMPLTVSWKGTGWDSIMQITSNYGGTSDATEFIVAFQSIK